MGNVKKAMGRLSSIFLIISSYIVLAVFIVIVMQNRDNGLRGSTFLSHQISSSPMSHRALPEIMAQLESPLYIFETKSVPSFTYAAATIDKDTSIAMNSGILEPAVSKTISHFSHECCARGGHFIDVGANFGWYTVYAAAMGCHVHAFEGVPLFASLVTLQRHLNPNISSRVHLHNKAVSFRTGDIVTMNIPRSAQKQRVFGATRAVFSSSNATENDNEIRIKTTTLDDALAPVLSMTTSRRAELCGLKMDIEGFEPYAFMGAKVVLSQLNHIIFEINKNKLCTLPDQATTACPIICEMIDSLRYEHHFNRMLIINPSMRDDMRNTDIENWNTLSQMSNLIDMPCSAIMSRFTGVKPDENGFVDPTKGIQFTINVWMSKI